MRVDGRLGELNPLLNFHSPLHFSHNTGRSALANGYRSGNVCSSNCRNLKDNLAPSSSLPCASRSLITLAAVTYARLRVVILHAVPVTRTVRYGPRSFAVAGPSVWNSLPAPLHSCHLQSSFRRDLKTELFIRSYHQHARDCFLL